MHSLKLQVSLIASAILLAGCSVGDDGPTEETIMQRQVEAHENVQIQLSNRVSALEQELQGVEGKIEELNHSIQQLVARQQDLYQQIDSLLWNTDFSDRSLRFGTGERQFTIGILYRLLADRDGVIPCVEVAPEKRRDLTLP